MNNDQLSMLLAYMVQSQSGGGFVQDFLFPFLLSAMSAMMGAYAAYHLLKRSEWIAEERKRLELLNKMSILAVDAFYQMLAIKSNYLGLLDSNPRKRIVTVPTIPLECKNFEVPHEFYLLLASVYITVKDYRWSQPGIYMVLVKNYKATLNCWNTRNEINQECKNSLMNGKAVVELEEEHIDEIFSEDKLCQWVDFTERSLVLTDDMLIEINSLVNDLSEITKKVISPKIIRKYGAMNCNIGDFNKKLLIRVPEVDISSLDFFHRDDIWLKDRFSSNI